VLYSSFKTIRLGAIPLILYSALLTATPSFAAQDVGKAATIKGSVTGSVRGKSRRLAKGKPVYLNERIKARSRSTGQFILRDNSKIAVGAGATVVLDKFLVSRGKKAKKVTLNVLRGALRFSSGRSGNKAYKIVTPTATLGVRGTLFDVTVVRGVTSVLLLRGSVDVCSSRGCSRLTDRCSYAVARRGRPVETGHTRRRRSNTRDVDPDLFPFAHSQRGLMRGLRARGSGCFSVTRKQRTKKVRPTVRRARVSPNVPTPPPTQPPSPPNEPPSPPNEPPSPPSEPPSDIPGNPGNTNPNGNAGNSPGKSGSKGDPGRGASDGKGNNGNRGNRGNSGN